MSRVIVAVVAIPFFIAAIWFGHIYFLALVMGMTLLGIPEILNLFRQKGCSPQTYSTHAFGATWILLFYLGSWEWSFPLLMAMILTLLIVELFRNDGSALLNVAATLFSVMYAAILMGSILVLRQTNSTMGAAFVFLVFASIWACDTSAYYGGRYLGKHKFFERVSPKKTWEGAVTGLLGACFGVFVVRTLFVSNDWTYTLSISQTLMIGIFGGTLGQVGDLAESLLKRDAAVKDSSSILPGHGGILDRFDSMLFVAPATYIYVTYIVN